MTYPIDNREDVIDSRNVIARIEELEGLAEEAAAAESPFDEDYADELATLKALAEAGELATHLRLVLRRHPHPRLLLRGVRQAACRGHRRHPWRRQVARNLHRLGAGRQGAANRLHLH